MYIGGSRTVGNRYWWNDTFDAFVELGVMNAGCCWLNAFRVFRVREDGESTKSYKPQGLILTNFAEMHRRKQDIGFAFSTQHVTVGCLYGYSRWWLIYQVVWASRCNSYKFAEIWRKQYIGYWWNDTVAFSTHTKLGIINGGYCWLLLGLPKTRVNLRSTAVLLIWKWQASDKMFPTNWWGEWYRNPLPGYGQHVAPSRI
jgi:hypothetical protein